MISSRSKFTLHRTLYESTNEVGSIERVEIWIFTRSSNEAYTPTPGQYRETLVLNLPPGNYKAECIDPASYSTLATEQFKQSEAAHVLQTPAYSIDIALRIRRQ